MKPLSNADRELALFLNKNLFLLKEINMKHAEHHQIYKHNHSEHHVRVLHHAVDHNGHKHVVVKDVHTQTHNVYPHQHFNENFTRVHETEDSPYFD